MRIRSGALLTAVGAVLALAIALAAGDDAANFPYIPFDHAAIQYLEQPVNDPISRLEQKINAGDVTIDYQPKWGYLPGLLKQLGITPDSQVLVFSKTSFQAPRISPAHPRALYFGDNVAVGFVQNGPVMELISLDPKQGAVFYTLDVNKGDKPSFHRQEMACLQCHINPGTLNIPGLVVSSVHPSADGTPYLRAGSFVTDHRSPLDERWGGWYVTGTHGSAIHHGNAVVRDSQQPTEFDLGGGQNLTSLESKFDTSQYLAHTSDIVALMTLEHQTRMVNLMTRIGWETRMAAQEGKLDQFAPRLKFIVEEFVTYMTFADEAPLREPIRGVSTFTETFPQRGPRDKQGRSLRDFNLKTRLFRYPLSYMIYSESFDNIPDLARQQIYRKLFDVLTGKDTTGLFAKINPTDRTAALEVLRETKSNLPAYWNM
jgi:hypothetical protein